MVYLTLRTYQHQLITKFLVITILAQVPQLILVPCDVCCQYFEMVYLWVVDMMDPVY